MLRGAGRVPPRRLSFWRMVADGAGFDEDEWACGREG